MKVRSFDPSVSSLAAILRYHQESYSYRILGTTIDSFGSERLLHYSSTDAGLNEGVDELIMIYQHVRYNYVVVIMIRCLIICNHYHSLHE